MFDPLTLISQHRSDRSFRDDPVAPAVLDEILRACQWAPTSANTQHVSVVVVQDPVKRSKLAELAGGQPWVAKAPVFLALVMDYYKNAQAMQLLGEPHVIQDYVEGTISAASDAGILLGQLLVAAHARGLGCVPIGGLRNNPKEVVELLQLPPLTFPLVGLCLGHVDKATAQRPRLPHETFRYDEVYGTPNLAAAIATYDETLLKHWAAVGRSNGQSWSAAITPYSDHNYRARLLPGLLQQGFRFDKDPVTE